MLNGRFWHAEFFLGRMPTKKYKFFSCQNSDSCEAVKGDMNDESFRLGANLAFLALGAMFKALFGM